MSGKRLTAEQITAMTAAASRRAIPARSPADIHVISIAELPVTDVRAYENNPRKHHNPKYEEIKESIRVRGVESALYITKRPGSDQYILAKGGKTRLQALHELAQEDPQKWGKHTFHEVPWVSESEILAAHLVENTGREAMCFWDLAQGIHTLKEQIAKETGKPVSTRNLPDLLGARGVKVERTTIAAAEFAIDYLQALGPWQEHLGLDHVHNVFRVKFNALLSLWQLKHRGDEDGFKSLVNHAVGACVAQHTEYSAELLVSAVVEASASAMGLSVQGMLAAMHQAESIKTIEDLQAVAQVADQHQTHAHSDAMPAGQGSDSGDDHGDGQGEGPTEPPAVPKPEKIRPNISDEARANLNRLMGSATSRASDVPGIPGVSVARGLTPRIPKGQEGEREGGQKGAGRPLSLEELEALEREGQEGLARRVLWDELMNLADVAGITSLVVASDSPYLDYGYYLELPAPGQLGTSPQDIAVQAWWLLASMNSQTDPARLPYLMGGEFDNPDGTKVVVPCAFRRQEPGSFAHEVLYEDSINIAIVERLGGQRINPFALLMMVATERRHPLYTPTLRLLDACTHFNEARELS